MGGAFAKESERHNASALLELKARRVRLVVLTSAYEWYLSERNVRGEPILVDSEDRSLPVERFISKRLRETILAIEGTGARVLLVTPHPRVKSYARDRRAVHLGMATQIYADYLAASKARRVILADLHGVPFTEIDGRSFLCSGPPCPILGDSMQPLLYDGNHLGSALAGRFAAQIADIAVGGAPGGVVSVGPHGK